MVKIIEHYDYDEPIDNETVVEVPTANNQKKKLFKIFDGVWVDPEAVEIPKVQTLNKIKLSPYSKNYCKTIVQKSKYLEQMTILFKKIKSTPLGQALLEDLYKGSPIDFSSSHVWNISNMVLPRTSNNTVNRRLRATCIIKPTTGYLINCAQLITKFGANIINTAKTTVYFQPDCICSFKTNNMIHYIDPDITLYHELLHVLHSTYGIRGTLSLEEEFITFGGPESLNYLSSKLQYYKNRANILLENLNLIKIYVNAISDTIDKKYFQEKYGFINNTTVDNKFIDNYINEYQSIHSEYNYVKQFDLNKFYRKSYKQELFLSFQFDISDPKVYNLKQGLLTSGENIENIKSNPSNILANIDPTKIYKYI